MSISYQACVLKLYMRDYPILLEAQAIRLRRQERFFDEFFLNLNVDKNCRLGDKYLVVFLNDINLLNKTL
ncbi:MAG: hypothetical protein ABI045_03590 [Flavobacteriales bacterium]